MNSFEYILNDATDRPVKRLQVREKEKGPQGEWYPYTTNPKTQPAKGTSKKREERRIAG